MQDSVLHFCILIMNCHSRGGGNPGLYLVFVIASTRSNLRLNRPEAVFLRTRIISC